jgi:hypothetical protein
MFRRKFGPKKKGKRILKQSALYEVSWFILSAKEYWVIRPRRTGCAEHVAGKNNSYNALIGKPCNKETTWGN